MRAALQLHPRGSPLPRTSGFSGNVRTSVRARNRRKRRARERAAARTEPGPQRGRGLEFRREAGDRPSAPEPLRRFRSRSSDYSDPQGRALRGQLAAPWSWRAEVSWEAPPRETASALMTSRPLDVSRSWANLWPGLRRAWGAGLGVEAEAWKRAGSHSKASAVTAFKPTPVSGL